MGGAELRTAVEQRCWLGGALQRVQVLLGFYQRVRPGFCGARHPSRLAQQQFSLPQNQHGTSQAVISGVVCTLFLAGSVSGFICLLLEWNRREWLNAIQLSLKNCLVQQQQL